MTSIRFLRRAAIAAFAAAVLTCAADPAVAKPVPASEIKDRTEPLPKRLEGVDVKEALDTTLPKDVAFHDDRGNPVRIGDYFDDTLPVIVTLNYSSCPMLCSLQLNGLVESLEQVDWTIGEDYRVVTIILDPDEPLERVQKTKSRYLAQYGRPGSEKGWHFLSGSEASIKAIAGALGFSYGYNEVRDEYVHPAAIAMATPKGRVARYLYGIEFHPKTVSLSLVEVAEGKIGSSVDQLVLYCFLYDETEGRYAPVAMNIMRVGGGTSALVLGGFLGAFWLAESRKKRQSRKSEGSARSSKS